ncbi:unnamed protein product [Lathyrus oleraceus]
MAAIFNFVYLIILFFSLYLAAMNVNAAIRCKTDSDCPQNMCLPPSVVKCMGISCTCVGSRVLPWEL